MRTNAFVVTLLASFILSGCASGSALDLRPRDAAAYGVWKARSTFFATPSAAVPLVDTSAQREALRRVPHGADRFNGTSGQR